MAQKKQNEWQPVKKGKSRAGRKISAPHDPKPFNSVLDAFLQVPPKNKAQ